MPRFQVETRVAAAPSACFTLSLSVAAHTASMAVAQETAVHSTARDAMRLGDSVTWRARHFGIWFRMTSAITAYEPPARFVDEQVSGPFARWWHEHRFEPVPNGGTHIIDVVNFRSPAGPIGSLVDRAVLSRYLRQLIQDRNAWLKQTLESSA